jgi:hypothetical protein
MTRDDIIKLREESDEWAEKHLQCEGEYHPDFHTVSDVRFANLVRNRMISEGWRQCAQGQRTTQHCAMAEQARLEEHEACARACESVIEEIRETADNVLSHEDCRSIQAAQDCVAAIRAQAADRLARHGIQIPEDEEYGNPSFG